MNLSTGTVISQLPTGTIDSLLDVFPLSIGVTGSTSQTIQASLLQTAQFLQAQGQMISGSYTTLNGRYQTSGTYSPDYIAGLKLQWNSSGSMSVMSGKAMTESGLLYIVTGTISVTVAGLGSGTLANVYLTGNNTFEVVTTGFGSPYLGTARSQAGNTAKRYLGSVKCDAGGYLYSFDHSGFLFTYRTNMNVSPFLILNGGTSTTFVNVDCSPVMPSGSTMMNLYFSNGATNAYIITSTSNDGYNHGTGGTIDGISNINPSAGVVTSHPVDGSRIFKYRMSASPTPLGAYIFALGYYLER